MASGNGRTAVDIGRRYTRDDWTDFAHAGPDALAGRYLRRFWQPVYRGDDLPTARAVPIRVMGEDLTLYRGTAPSSLAGEGGDGGSAGGGGKAHVLAFRCAHRGTQLSTGWVEGDDLRCFYHGWKYDSSGQCIEQPAEPLPFCDGVRIRSCPTEEYLGLIFAYLGEGEPPPLPRYPELEGEGVLDVGEPVVWPCNYYNRIENSADEVHLAFVHRESGFTESGLVDIPQIWAEETEFGFTKYGRRADGTVRVSHFHMPNANYIKGSPNDQETGWVEHLSWRVPVDDEHCKSYVMSLTHVSGEAADRYRERRRARLERAAGAKPAELGEAVLGGRLRIEDIEERTFIVNVQDYVAQVGQGAIADRTNERLGRSDAVLILLRKIWARELRALAEGRPLKRWQRARSLQATAGV